MKLTRWLVLGALLFVTGASQAEKKAYSSGHFTLELDGSPTLVKSIDGGGVKKTADSAPITLEIDRSGSEAMWQWLAASLSQGPVKKPIAVVAKGKRRMDMVGCHIVELKLPKLDAKDGKKNLSVSVVIQPEAASENKDDKDLKGVVNVKQKAFLPSNFKVSIGDLPTKGVKKIDAMSFKMKVQDNKAKVTIPDIKLTIASPDESAWSAAIKSKAKKSGTIQLTDADGSVWKTLDLGGVRVTSVKTVTDGAEVTLSVDTVSLH